MQNAISRGILKHSVCGKEKNSKRTVKEVASYNMKYNVMTLLNFYGPSEIILVLQFFHLRCPSDY